MSTDTSSPPSLETVFAHLDDIEFGDVLHVHFRRDGIGGVTFLMSMLYRGVFTSGDYLTLMAVNESRDWGGQSNRHVTLKVTDRFDAHEQSIFRRLRNFINDLNVETVRPLVDEGVIDCLGERIKYRFRVDSIDGVQDMLDLHEMGVIHLNNTWHLTDALVDREWREWYGQGRSGTFINRMEDPAFPEHFRTEILPHLELLRVDR